VEVFVELLQRRHGVVEARGAVALPRQPRHELEVQAGGHAAQIGQPSRAEQVPRVPLKNHVDEKLFR